MKNLRHCYCEIKLGSFCTFGFHSVIFRFFRSKKLCRARARRTTARRSYRSSLISSGSARRIASVAPSCSVVDIVTAPALGVSDPPNPLTRDITATLTRSICARSNWACAIVRAYSRVRKSAVAPAILRASRSISLIPSAFAAVRPWRKEFRLDLFLPGQERGPVLRRALRRLAAICRSVATDYAATRGFFEASSSARILPSMTRSILARSCCPTNPPRKSASKRSALLSRASCAAISRSSFSRSGAAIRIAAASTANSSSPNRSNIPKTSFLSLSSLNHCSGEPINLVLPMKVGLFA